MNDFNTETPVGEAGIVDVKHFYIDENGNRIEIPFDAAGVESFSNGEAASEETTVYVAEDLADTRVEPTVH